MDEEKPEVLLSLIMAFSFQFKLLLGGKEQYFKRINTCKRHGTSKERPFGEKACISSAHVDCSFIYLGILLVLLHLLVK